MASDLGTIGLDRAGRAADAPFMYSLDQDLARRRLLYPRPLPTLPDLLVIDIPTRFAGDTLPLGRYYPIIVETECEQREVCRFLGATRAGPVVPDLLDDRPSQLSCDRVTIATYEPPVPGWPFLLLCHWPSSVTRRVGDRHFFARGAYTTELFGSLEELVVASTALLGGLGHNHLLDVTLVAHHGHAGGHA